MTSASAPGNSTLVQVSPSGAMEMDSGAVEDGIDVTDGSSTTTLSPMRLIAVTMMIPVIARIAIPRTMTTIFSTLKFG